MSEWDQLRAERDRLITQRDAAVARAEAAERRLINAAGFDVADLMHSLDECIERAEKAEQMTAALSSDLEAAEQALQRVREAFQHWSGGPDDEFEQAMRRALDGPP